MKVQNKYLLHITGNVNLKVGDIIIAGQQDNPFWNFAKKYSPTATMNGQTIPLFQMFEQFNCQDFAITMENIDWLYGLLKTVSKEAAFYIREQVFEEIRRESAPNLPSRHSCLWLTEDKDILYWSTMNSNSRNVLRLELNGELFCADEFWLKANTLSSDEYRNRATKYWSGVFTNTAINEYLFSGEAIVREVTPLGQYLSKFGNQYNNGPQV